MKKPTTTHFAILGLLAARPWSTYELIQYMQGSYIRAFWTKTEGRLYEAPRELVSMGLADVRKERISDKPKASGRKRAIYSITQEGRKALKHWLKQPSQPPAMEDERLLRLAFADQGTKDELLEQIAAMRDELIGVARPDVVEQAGTDPQVPSRVHISAHLADLWVRLTVTRIEWLNDFERDVRKWETAKSNADNRVRGKDAYRDLARRMKKQFSP